MEEVIRQYLLESVVRIYGIVIFGCVFFFIEHIRPAHKNGFFKSEFRQEAGISVLNALIFSYAVTFLVSLFLEKPVSYFVPPQLFDETIQSWPAALQIVFALAVADMSTYWRHRVTHSVKYLWVWHAVHHSVKQISWISGLRLHPVDVLVAGCFDAAFLYIAGFSGEHAATAALILVFYNYFTHANIDLDYPKPLCYVLASPNFHRWHHETRKEAHNKNFCSVFSLYDLMFGTYYYPAGKKPEEYGLPPKQQALYGAGLKAQLVAPFGGFVRLLSKK